MTFGSYLTSLKVNMRNLDSLLPTLLAAGIALVLILMVTLLGVHYATLADDVYDTTETDEELALMQSDGSLISSLHNSTEPPSH